MDGAARGGKTPVHPPETFASQATHTITHKIHSGISLPGKTKLLTFCWKKKSPPSCLLFPNHSPWFLKSGPLFAILFKSMITGHPKNYPLSFPPICACKKVWKTFFSRFFSFFGVPEELGNPKIKSYFFSPSIAESIPLSSTDSPSLPDRSRGQPFPWDADLGP